MIDTITIESPFISEETSKIFELQSVVKTAISMQDNNIIYEFTNASLEGSYDARISIQVRKEKWVKYALSPVPQKTKTKPYLRIECSLHKFIFGTNVIGGIDDLQLGTKILLGFIEKSFDCTLPRMEEWFIRRIDFSKNYTMMKEDKKHYILGLNHSSYPRRNVNRFGHKGIYISGTTTTVKIYDKYYDFLKHDKKRLKKYADSCIYQNIRDKTLQFIDYLSFISENIIRFEVEIKLRKLQSDLNKEKEDIKITDIRKEYLESIYLFEVNKLLKLSEEGKQVFCKNDDVMSILKETFGSRKSNSLYSFWVQYTTMGENWVKENYSKATFYRLRKELKQANISLTTSDIKVDKNVKVITFIPKIDNDNKDTSEYVKNIINMMYSKYVA